MNKLRKLAIFGMFVATLAAAPATSYADAASYAYNSNPHTVPAMSHTLCDYVTDGTRPLLVRGSRGNAVKQAQCLINIYSFAPGTLAVDGIFGPKTEAAVRWVQQCARTHGRPGTYVDGKVGSQTWNILYNQPSGCGTRQIGNPN